MKKLTKCIRDIIEFYKSYFHFIDTAIVSIVTFKLYLFLKEEPIVLFSSYFQIEKTSLYSTFSVLAPTLLGFVLTALSVVITFLGSNEKLHKLIKEHSSNYLEYVFKFSRWSLSALTCISFYLYLTDNDDFIKNEHLFFVFFVLLSALSIIHIVIVLGDILYALLHGE